MRRLLIALVALGLAACGGSPGATATTTSQPKATTTTAPATHSLTINVQDNCNCNPYDPLTGGTDQVTVEDQSGTTIAVGTLGGSVSGGLSYTATVTVPTNETFYEIAINGVKGNTTYSHAEIVSDDWTADITYGSS